MFAQDTANMNFYESFEDDLSSDFDSSSSSASTPELIHPFPSLSSENLNVNSFPLISAENYFGNENNNFDSQQQQQQQPPSILINTTYLNSQLQPMTMMVTPIIAAMRQQPGLLTANLPSSLSEATYQNSNAVNNNDPFGDQIDSFGNSRDLSFQSSYEKPTTMQVHRVTKYDQITKPAHNNNRKLSNNQNEQQQQQQQPKKRGRKSNAEKFHQQLQQEADFSSPPPPSPTINSSLTSASSSKADRPTTEDLKTLRATTPNIFSQMPIFKGIHFQGEVACHEKPGSNGQQLVIFVTPRQIGSSANNNNGNGGCLSDRCTDDIKILVQLGAVKKSTACKNHSGITYLLMDMDTYPKFIEMARDRLRRMEALLANGFL